MKYRPVSASLSLQRESQRQPVSLARSFSFSPPRSISPPNSGRADGALALQPSPSPTDPHRGGAGGPASRVGDDFQASPAARISPFRYSGRLDSPYPVSESSATVVEVSESPCHQEGGVQRAAPPRNVIVDAPVFRSAELKVCTPPPSPPAADQESPRLTATQSHWLALASPDKLKKVPTAKAKMSPMTGWGPARQSPRQQPRRPSRRHRHAPVLYPPSSPRRT
eukprot:Hpha_TRINITY_DN17959_c0_g1::TRINITY_DN17959_c0_g1_i1::g.33740::m.33740